MKAMKKGLQNLLLALLILTVIVSCFAALLWIMGSENRAKDRKKKLAAKRQQEASQQGQGSQLNNKDGLMTTRPLRPFPVSPSYNEAMEIDRRRLGEEMWRQEQEDAERARAQEREIIAEERNIFQRFAAFSLGLIIGLTAATCYLSYVFFKALWDMVIPIIFEVVCNVAASLWRLGRRVVSAFWTRGFQIFVDAFQDGIMVHLFGMGSLLRIGGRGLQFVVRVGVRYGVYSFGLWLFYRLSSSWIQEKYEPENVVDWILSLIFLSIDNTGTRAFLVLTVIISPALWLLVGHDNAVKVCDLCKEPASSEHAIHTSERNLCNSHRSIEETRIRDELIAQKEYEGIQSRKEDSRKAATLPSGQRFEPVPWTLPPRNHPISGRTYNYGAVGAQRLGGPHHTPIIPKRQPSTYAGFKSFGDWQGIMTPIEEEEERSPWVYRPTNETHGIYYRIPEATRRELFANTPMPRPQKTRFT